MARPKGSKSKKDPYANLPEEFKDAVAQGSTEDVYKKISEVALNQAALMEAKELDQDLKEKQELYKTASELYREGSKANKLKIKYCKQVLDSRGVQTN